MRIIQSFWSKPIKEALESGNGLVGGWLEPKYFFMSSALSALTIRKFYSDLELYTDEWGYYVFTELLDLPFTRINSELSEIDHYPSKLWALGKIYTYGIQIEPFIHLDGDIYLYKKLPDHLNEYQLIGQHKETITRHYNYGIAQLKHFDFELPEVISQYLDSNPEYCATNAGILGGYDLNFFRRLKQNALDMIEINRDKLDFKFNPSNYALIYEQLLFTSMANEANLNVGHLIHENEIPIIKTFYSKYSERKFVHLLGDSKRNLDSCVELADQLRMEFPTYYDRILKFF